MKKIIGSIKANYEDGEGEVKLNSEFELQDALWRMDVLRDIIYDLQKKYQKAFKENRKYYANIYQKKQQKARESLEKPLVSLPDPDRVAHRALVEAGYAPLQGYIEKYGEDK